MSSERSRPAHRSRFAVRIKINSAINCTNSLSAQSLEAEVHDVHDFELEDVEEDEDVDEAEDEDEDDYVECESISEESLVDVPIQWTLGLLKEM
ncbi:hypothetical protein LR48_Vigan08g016900 [Vigna angularis]|uniref:Uncharacterized protein n=1 Tax=Phaseolus angularis TaxID=3914 RepID=A0A0L9V342_PHAAN|nr:hypothetical protein LR48_Vigan08g016900 [Vigna angularis]